MTKARTLADNFAADINGITAGTGITGGGTSGTVTITNQMATTIDAKGDLVVGTGADTFGRLAVASTAGYLLTVDSAEATGLKWSAPAAAGFVGVSVYDTGIAQTIPNNTATTLLWNSEEYDTDGFHSTTTNTSRLTVPSGKGGYYLVTFAQSWAPNATGLRAYRILKNGSIYRLGTDYIGNSTVYVGNRITCIVPLSAGDYVEAVVRQTSGGDLDCFNDGVGSNPIFQMHYLGA